MSRELQDKADIVMRELKEMLVPISKEIRTRRYYERSFFVERGNTGKME